jgi:hypothetical protein
MKIKLLDSKFQNNQNSDNGIITQTKALKIARKLELDQFSELEYHDEFGYFNFVIENEHTSIPIQLVLKGNQLFYHGLYMNSQHRELTNRLFCFLFDEGIGCNKFNTGKAAIKFCRLIEDSISDILDR